MSFLYIMGGMVYDIIWTDGGMGTFEKQIIYSKMLNGMIISKLEGLDK